LFMLKWARIRIIRTDKDIDRHRDGSE
jgi:hypothetical protein